ncbi:MAG: insulinase family protein, partial [Candidatus Rokubacteria bacterium]|nr:insulinase family protein [Candidatus Rokubacteria bacterium]
TPTREVLANGLVLIVQEHRASEVVALQLWMRVGGRDEAPDELGLSHYLEHMLFKGTPTRPPGSIDRLIEGLGGQSNAFTSQDFTHYDVVLPAEHLRAGLELLADIAVNASFDPEELQAEKKVVFEEMRLTEDHPDRFMLRRLYELAYAPHPYGRPILGTQALIGPLTRERLRAYYKKLYVPRNMSLVVVGAVDPGQVRRVAGETFGRLAGGPGPRPPLPPLPPLDRGRRAEVPRPEQQAHLGLGWQTAPTNHPDVYAVDLLTYILGDSPSSRLNQAVRERDRLVFSIEAGYGAWERGGVVTVIARLDPANLEKAEASILDVGRRARAEGVTEAERQRAIVTAEANYAFDIETAEGLAKTYGQAETTWTLDDELQYLARLRQVSAAEIQAVARKYFGDDNYTRVRFVPREAGRLAVAGSPWPWPRCSCRPRPAPRARSGASGSPTA